MAKQPFSKSEDAALVFSDLIAEGERLLSRTSSSARLDAELLCAHACGISRSSLLARLRDVCSADFKAQFHSLIQRRALGEPIAYIRGTREFWGLDFTVSPAVLVPRPESELMIEEALRVCELAEVSRIADLGTGSGCLAIALLVELKKRGRTVSCTAVDISATALQVAAANAKAHGVHEQITFVQSDWFTERTAFASPYQLILANPPYVDRTETLARDLAFEPSNALFSDDHGLFDTKRIIEDAAEMLAPGGVLLVEVGAYKRAALRQWFADHSLPYRWSFLGDGREQDGFTVVRLERI